MATDAVFQFNYSDDKHLSSFYKKSDAFPSNFLNDLIVFLNEIELKEKYRDGRLNWGYVVTALISKFFIAADRLDNIKMINEVGKNDQSFIYKVTITPIADKYLDKSFRITDTIQLELKYQIDGEVLYNGLLSRIDYEKF